MAELARMLESTHLATTFANSNRRTREAQIEPAVKYDQSKKGDVAAWAEDSWGDHPFGISASSESSRDVTRNVVHISS